MADPVTLAELLMSDGKLAGQRPDQQLAPDWREKLLALGAGAADPLSIPSAATGLVSPEARDAWRATQGAHSGAASAALSPDAQADIRRSVANFYMAGKDLPRIDTADVQDNHDPAAVGAYLDTLRSKVGKLPTRIDQLNAIKADAGDVADDPTSPTGRRHVNGQFAGAAP